MEMVLYRAYALRLRAFCAVIGYNKNQWQQFVAR